MAKRTARMGDWDLQVFVADPDCFASIVSIAKKTEMRKKGVAARELHWFFKVGSKCGRNSGCVY